MPPSRRTPPPPPPRLDGSTLRAPRSVNFQRRDPEGEVLLLNDSPSFGVEGRPDCESCPESHKGTHCGICGEIHQFKTIKCQPCTFPRDLAAQMNGTIVPLTKEEIGRYRQAQLKVPVKTIG